MTTVFPPSEAIVATQRLHLSHLTAEAVAAMPWLDAALAPDWKLEALVAAVEAGKGVLISDSSDLPLGAAIVFLGRPSLGDATVPVLAIDPSRRFRGLGGEAAIALERYLRSRHGIETVYAPVPDGRGLAVYFWLRQGYRPVTVAGGPGPLIGLTDQPRPGIWMVRESA
jgi:GNAT superfamily N-acetyltransferase